MYQALSVVNEMDLKEVDVTQVTIAKARKVTTGTMMLARNPVMMISATKA
jgi:cobalt-precorrin-6B (C15)-methyltransferase